MQKGWIIHWAIRPLGFLSFGLCVLSVSYPWNLYPLGCIFICGLSVQSKFREGRTVIWANDPASMSPWEE